MKPPFSRAINGAMTRPLTFHDTDLRQDRYLARSRRAARIAGWVKLALAASVLAAIWQDKALAPAVHDRMQPVAGLAASLLARDDARQAEIAMAPGSLPVIADGRRDPAGTWPLDPRQ